MKTRKPPFGCLRGLRRQISRSTALLRHVLKGIATVTVIPIFLLHQDNSFLQLDFNLLDLNFHVAIITKSRLPIPSGKVDRLVATILVAGYAPLFLELQSFMSGEVLRNDDIRLPLEVLRQDLCWRVELTCTPR
jgi:hypothetical protein